MTDFLEDYRKLVHERLDSQFGRPLEAVSCTKAVAEVVFLPSFHPETILQVTQQELTQLRLTSFSSSLWYSVSGYSPAPELMTEIVNVPEDSSTFFWTAIGKLQLENIRSTGAVGVDGLSVDVCHVTTDRANIFSGWGPTPESPQGQFILLFYDLAWKLLSATSSIKRLEHLHGYLGLGLPARFIEGNPRCLRLFGSLSSSSENALRGLFDSVRRDEALVVDMTNFDGMGTLLYPAFSDFSETHPGVVWAGSNNARRHLEGIGIDGAVIRTTVEEATSLFEGR